MLNRDVAFALDASLFAEACGVTPDPWQAELLRAMPPRCALNCSRQSGKSTVTALAALHCSLYESGSLVVLIAPAQRQSAELLRTVRLLHQKLDDAVPLASESVLKLEFRNNSRVIALPGGDADGKTIRGLAGARLLVCDEASRIPDALYSAVRPMAATNKNAALIALSTPAGKRGWFYELWHNGDPLWHRVRVPASECPRISKEFLAEERKALGPSRYSEEYELQFVDSSAAAFPTTIIDSAFTTGVTPLWH